jgi:molybdenum cofactor cytidylyltransferase
LELNMDLVTALRIEPSATAPPRLAFVGAGGKTTALFQAARGWLKQSEKTGIRAALAGATTHLATAQLALADRYFISPAADDFLRLGMEPPNGLILFSGPLTADERTLGLEGAGLEGVRRLADRLKTALFLEADGARRLPLKAPADHEPVIPPWVNQVVVLAGLSGLGKPLDSNHVHRQAVFARLSGLEAGMPVDVPALASVLTHPQGGLKAIPAGARRVAMLNQADTPGLQSQANALAQQLLDGYEAVLIAALKPASAEVSAGVLAVHEQVAGVVLAAGASERLGRPKQLLVWRGEPLIRHVVKAAAEAGLRPLKIVTGAYTDEIEAALQGLSGQVVHNAGWETGQASSVIAGVDSLPPTCGAAVFLLADQPQVPATMLRSLVARHAQTLASLVAPMVDGRRANPVLFDRRTFEDLRKLEGDTGGRPLFARYQAEWLPWHDPSVMLDVDTEQDYQHLLELDG